MNYLERYINKFLSNEEGDHMFLMFGCDYAYVNSDYNFKEMESVINHWNKAYPHINMFFSTPGRYMENIKAKNEEFKKQKDNAA